MGDTLLPPSDAYVRRFLYLLYTLIKLYYTKALSDPASSLALDEFISSGGQESRVSSFSNNLSSWGLIRDPSGQDGPDNLCEPISADSRNPESAV